MRSLVCTNWHFNHSPLGTILMVLRWGEDVVNGQPSTVSDVVRPHRSRPSMCSLPVTVPCSKILEYIMQPCLEACTQQLLPFIFFAGWLLGPLEVWDSTHHWRPHRLLVMSYCCEVCGNTYKSNIECMYLLQKKVVRMSCLVSCTYWN